MRVLLIEDERSLARSIEVGLAAEGIDVDVEHDGESGLWRATEASYDVIVLDIMLPRLNGFQVCAELRDRGVSAPVLMLTAKQGEYDEAEALDTGADDYLRKPFSFVVLLARLRALARRTSSDRQPVVALGSVRLDMRRRQAMVADRDLTLTRREFAVLERLLSSPGEPVAAEALHAHVWGFDTDTDLNVVQVNIASLRRKLGSVHGAAEIATIRGIGYVLEVPG